MDQEVEIPSDVMEDTAAVTPPAGEGQAGSGAGAPNETRTDKRIAALTGQRHAADRAADRERQRADAAEQRAAEAERRADMMSEAGHGLAERNTTEAIKRSREALDRALADGDTKAQGDAMEALAEAKAQAMALQGQKPQPRQQTQQTRPPQPSAQAQAWVADNQWFKDDPAKQAKAMAIHEELIADGITADSRAYYKELTARTREMAGADTDDDEPPAQVRPHAGAGVSRTAAPAAAKPGTKVRLTAAEIETARDLGISVEKYAAGKQAAMNAGRLGPQETRR